MTVLTSTPDATLTTLTAAQRDELIARIDADGYAVLPGRLPADLQQRLLDQIDDIAARQRAADPSVKSVKQHNCVANGGAMLELVMYEPALQLCHDMLGPVFLLNQSNFISRVQQKIHGFNAAAAIGWHADGPHPRNFPTINGVMGLHYLKFAYFLTDLAHGSGGSLEVVRGSHKRPELDGKGAAFDSDDYADDVIRFDVEPGSIVAFHQAQWHAAHPNASQTERKNLYISYCHAWMTPLDYDLPREGEAPDGLEGLSPEASFLLGEYRPPLRFWLPSAEDKQRLARYGR